MLTEDREWQYPITATRKLWLHSVTWTATGQPHQTKPCNSNNLYQRCCESQQKNQQPFPLEQPDLWSPRDPLHHPSNTDQALLSFLYSMHSFYSTPEPASNVQSLTQVPQPLPALFHCHTSLHHRKSVVGTLALPSEHHSNAVSLNNNFQTPVYKAVPGCDEVSHWFCTKWEK